MRRAIRLMESSPCDVPMSQAVWLLGSVKFPHALDYDARIIPISLLEPLSGCLGRETRDTTMALLHARDHERSAHLDDIIRLPHKFGGMGIQAVADVEQAASIA